MKKKKTSPHFKSLADEARFWDSHSPHEYDFKPVHVEASPQLKKRLISIRIHESLLAALKALARKKRIPYQSLAHTLLERIVREELHRAA